MKKKLLVLMICLIVLSLSSIAAPETLAKNVGEQATSVSETAESSSSVEASTAYSMHVGTQSGSETIWSEDFESAWPGSWTCYDANAYNGYDYWGRTSYKGHNGGQSIWCAENGEQDVTIFSETFEVAAFPGTSWTVGDWDSDSELDYWDDTNYRSHGGSWSVWCAQMGGHLESETVFTEDFEGAFPGTAWHVGDWASGCGNDYWGDTYERCYWHPGEIYSAWCAQEGRQHEFPYDPNSDVHWYDDGMHAYMYRDVYLGSYQYCLLYFKYWIWTEPDYDYLEVMYYSGGVWNYVSRITGSSWGSWQADIAGIPRTATKVGFFFHSDGSNHHYEGAYIDDVELVGVRYVSNALDHRYDSDMDAFMYRSVSLGDYSSASLTYWYWLSCDYPNDYLEVVYYSEGDWHPAKSHSGDSGGWKTSTVSIPTSASYVGFRFRSDPFPFYDNTYEGAYIDDVKLIAHSLNNVLHKYDDNMAAYTYRSVNLSDYSSVWLSYWYWLDCDSNIDNVGVMYYCEGSWSYVDSHFGNSGGWQNSTVFIPASATAVGFYFHSKIPISRREGAYVDDAILTGIRAMTILSENFEGTFPGTAIVGDWNPASGYDYWGNTNYRAHSGSSSAWCAQVGNHYSEQTIWTENFEGGFPKVNWLVGDWNTTAGLDYWDDIDYNPYTGSRSCWCADIGSHDLIDLIFYEGFELGLSSPWETGDENSYSDLDYWGDSGYRYLSDTRSAWCAAVGFQHDTGQSNAAVHRYDLNMGAWMDRPVSLGAYYSVTLYYDYWLVSELNYDYLKVYWWDGSPHYLASYTGNSGGWQHGEVSIPTSALYVGFYFLSDAYNHNYEGAYIDNVGCYGIKSVPNNSDHKIDYGMNAYMYRAANLAGYTSVKLHYHYWLSCDPIYNYLQVMYSTGDFPKVWHFVDTHSGYDPVWRSTTISIPTSATAVGFFFHSEIMGSGGDPGAYIDDVELIGIKDIPNNVLHVYDVDQQSYMYWPVDLSGYSSVWLSYWYWLSVTEPPMSPGLSVGTNNSPWWDFLEVIYYSEGAWHSAYEHPEWYTGGWNFSAVPIPNSATYVGFCFTSTILHWDSYEGAYIDDITLTGIPFEFSVSASPPSGIVVAGAFTTYTTTATLVSGTTRSVSWSASGLPTGATPGFTPPSGYPTFNSTLEMTTSPSTPPGIYTITITGTGPCTHGSHSTTVQMKMMNFTVTPTPFSPNGDGVKDKTTIRATFWTSLSWTLVVKNSTGTVVRNFGNGTSSSLSKTWNGKDDLGNFVPEGTYTIYLSGPGFTKTKTVTVDINPPTVTSVSVNPTSFKPSLGQKTTINYTLSESCYVTIKMFNSTGNLVKTRLNNVLQAAGPHSVVWNGRNDASKIVPAGTYTIRIWVVDNAGNRASPYPINKTVTVL